MNATVYCPDHGSELTGGPFRYRCPHGHNVQAADADNESERLWL